MPETPPAVHPPEERFRTFFDLSAPSSSSPGFCANAFYAYAAFQAGTEPWSKTLYAQRTTPLGFRRELAYALSDGAGEPALPRSPEIDAVLARAKNPRELTPLQLAHLSRVLIYLGFPEDALALVRERPARPAESPEEAYWSYCGLFAQHLFLDARSANSLMEDALRLHEALSPDPRNLRVRLITSLLGLVWGARFAGRGGNPGPRGAAGWTEAAGGGIVGSAENLRAWRDKVLEAWKLTEDSNAFSPFERDILHSRVYRATSFIPYFEGDYVALESEIDSCLALARAAKPSNAVDDALRRDNLLATLESASRARSGMGDHEGALEHIKELTGSVEPYDSKPWLQLGELHEKQGHEAEAERAYRRSGFLAPPMGMIAWFKLGSALERQGRLEEARDAFLSSLKSWPNGLTPLLRLYALSGKTGDADLRSRTRARLEAALSEPGLLPQSRDKILALLADAPAA